MVSVQIQLIQKLAFSVQIINNFILYQKFLNERKRKGMLLNDTLDEELFQNDLTEQLTIENSNVVISLTATPWCARKQTTT